MSLRRSMIFSLGGATPLDEVGATSSNTLVAYGLRKLSNNYSGSVLRVRNSVGAIGDLAFDSSNEVSTSSVVTITTAAGSFSLNSTHALSAFANGGNVTVQTWYDQSGNSRDISQATPGSQPYLMLSGAFSLVDNKPCVFTNNQTRFFRNTYTYEVGSSPSKFWYYAIGGSVLISKSNSEYPLFQTSNMTDCGSGGGIMWWGYRNFYNTLTTQFYPSTYQRFRKTYESSANCTNTYYLISSGGIPDGDIAPQMGVYNNSPYTNNYIVSFVDNNTATRLNDYTYQIGVIENAGTPPVGAYQRAFINGSPQIQLNYGRPRTNIAPLNLTMFNTTSVYNEKMQELILLNGQNNFSERNIIEKNMGRYYNINVA